MSIFTPTIIPILMVFFFFLDSIHSLPFNLLSIHEHVIKRIICIAFILVKSFREQNFNTLKDPTLSLSSTICYIENTLHFS
jgi:hypothetical protein